jgi:signal transduction histidine kinase
VFEASIHTLSRYVTVAGITAILVNCIYSIYKGYTPAWFILAGLSMFFSGALIKLFDFSNEEYIFPPSLMHYGMALETIIISYGLIYGYRKERTERMRLKMKLQEQRQSESEHIINALENDRKRIARDLHDEVGNDIIILNNTVRGLSTDLPFNKVKKQELLDLGRQIRDEVRNISHQLMPPEIAGTSLSQLIQSRVDLLNEDLKVAIDYDCTGDRDIFNDNDKKEIYLIVLELITNIYNHAKADEATVQLLYYDEYLRIMIDDTGRGMNVAEQEGFGLGSVRSRVNYLRGAMNIDSNSKGTTIDIKIPYR